MDCYYSASETMEDLIQAKFTPPENDDPDYPNMSGLSNSHVFVAPRPTKASLGNAAIAKTRREKLKQVCVNVIWPILQKC